jgi:hypothetical protein
MKVLGLEIKRVEDDKQVIEVSCFHCARRIFVRKENVRTTNYCMNC